MTPRPWPRSPKAGPAARRLSGALGLLALIALPMAARAQDTGLRVTGAWVRTILPSRPAAGYFTLSNEGAQARTLVSAASPDCGMLMLHQSVQESGQEKMIMLDHVDIPAHGKITFAPGGRHLMCTSPAATVAPGHAIAVTLRFKDGGTLTTRFPVRGPTGK